MICEDCGELSDTKLCEICYPGSEAERNAEAKWFMDALNRLGNAAKIPQEDIES